MPIFAVFEYDYEGQFLVSLHKTQATAEMAIEQLKAENPDWAHDWGVEEWELEE